MFFCIQFVLLDWLEAAWHDIFFLQISLLSSIVLRHAWCSLTAVCCLAWLEQAWQFQGYLTEIGQAVHQCAASNLSSLRRLKWPQAFSSCFKRFKTLSTKKWVFLMNTWTSWIYKVSISTQSTNCKTMVKFIHTLVIISIRALPDFWESLSVSQAILPGFAVGILATILVMALPIHVAINTKTWYSRTLIRSCFLKY